MCIHDCDLFLLKIGGGNVRKMFTKVALITELFPFNGMY